jgi:hypothetical protein
VVDLHRRHPGERTRDGVSHIPEDGRPWRRERPRPSDQRHDRSGKNRWPSMPCRLIRAQSGNVQGALRDALACHDAEHTAWNGMASTPSG